MPAHNVECYGLVNPPWGGGMRPAPVCSSVDSGVHISTSCYHGYERVRQTPTQLPNHGVQLMELDCEISTVSPQAAQQLAGVPRKRSGDELEARRVKRLREEVHKEMVHREDVEKRKEMEQKAGEELLEHLLWGTHGGCLFHLQGTSSL